MSLMHMIDKGATWAPNFPSIISCNFLKNNDYEILMLLLSICCICFHLFYYIFYVM
jgi:hypothetical protein